MTIRRPFDVCLLFGKMGSMNLAHVAKKEAEKAEISNAL
jgi:hypothetical protein